MTANNTPQAVKPEEAKIVKEPIVLTTLSGDNQNPEARVIFNALDYLAGSSPYSKSVIHVISPAAFFSQPAEVDKDGKEINPSFSGMDSSVEKFCAWLSKTGRTLKVTVKNPVAPEKGDLLLSGDEVRNMVSLAIGLADSIRKIASAQGRPYEGKTAIGQPVSVYDL